VLKEVQREKDPEGYKKSQLRETDQEEKFMDKEKDNDRNSSTKKDEREIAVQRKLNMSAAASQAIDRSRKRKERNRDMSAFDTHEIHYRAYDKKLQKLTLDHDNYENAKVVAGSEFFPETRTNFEEPKATRAAARKVATLLEEEELQRAANRNRSQGSSAPFESAINAGNEVFNKRLNKFYDKYTAEIQQNLERGTAL
jgi:hypothetical protein